jgi:addiction module HigA family antidote
LTHTKKVLEPIHPGEILAEEFLEPLGMTPYKLAQDIGVPPTRVYSVVRGRRAVSADTALRLARYFGTSAEFWLNLQNHYDLEVEEDRAGERIEREVRPRAAAPATA